MKRKKDCRKINSNKTKTNLQVDTCKQQDYSIFCNFFLKKPTDKKQTVSITQNKVT